MQRPDFLAQIQYYFQIHPIVALLGPRQCGKTTLANMLLSIEPNFLSSNYFDLENPLDVERLKNPILTLTPLKGLIIIDEIQRIPELFPVLRYITDTFKEEKKFLILGSASRELIQQSSESLAGRIAYLELTPFTCVEVENFTKLWTRGGFPKSYLAPSDHLSFEWREFYIQTFLEQDIPNLGIQIPPASLRRFWTMISHYHGNIFNASEIGRSFGASDMTMRKYLDILTGTFMIRQLLPYFANVSKRQVKSPKIYFRDSGILHNLMNIDSYQSLQTHPKVGASWEGFALEEILRIYKTPPSNCYFWATHSGAELDLLIDIKGKLLAFEFKYCDAPTITKSMKIAMEDLSLDSLTVVYPGDKDYQLNEKIFVKSLKTIAQTHLLKKTT